MDDFTHTSGSERRTLGADASTATSMRLCFGPFSLRNQGAVLYRHEEPVRIGNRALQILAVLINRAEQVVSKSDLMDQVWPDTTVAENNLTVHIAALRQALGDGQGGTQYIINVPSRGYRFVAPVVEEPDFYGASLSPPKVSTLSNLPVRLRPVVGLSKAIEEVTAKLQTSDLVTVTGPAGVGKTTLALHVALAERSRYPDGVWLVDLASLREAEHIPAAVAATMRIELGSADPTITLVRTLSRSKSLLLLDNCEHLIDATADLAALIGQHCPDIVILATSREPLWVSDEAVYNLVPMAMPPDTAALSASEALGYPAVKLFVDRVKAAANDFTLLDEEARAAASICRRLDGLPLAIEFASALVGPFGVAGLAARLDDRIKLMKIDIRGAPDRHRTLTAALDWSYDLLDEAEQIALQRLAVFAGGFTLEGAAAVIGVADFGEVGGVLAKLHVKSLITSDITSENPRFRLLETTRAYAFEKLEGSGDGDVIRLRHAVHFRDLLREHRVHLAERDMAADAIELDNIRAALRFTMGSGGDINIALSLASAAVPVWLGISLMSECRAHLREVLALLTPEQAMSPEGWDLELARRTTEMLTVGTTPEAYGRWLLPPSRPPGDVHQLYERLAHNSDVPLRIVWNGRFGDANETRRLIKKHALREDDTLYNQISNAWLFGYGAFYLGEPEKAELNLRQFLETETPEIRRIFVALTGVDRVAHVRGMLGASLCLLGHTDEGLREARLAEEVGRASSNSFTLLECKAYAYVAYEIALIEHPDFQAEPDAFLELARNQGCDCYVAFGLGLRGVWTARQERHDQAEGLFRQSVDLMQRTGFEWCAPWFHSQLGEVIARQGRIQEGLEIIEAWMQRDRNPSGWYAAELHRSVGTLHTLAGNSDHAERAFAKALAIADSQGAVMWARRAHHDLDRIRG